MTSWFGEGTPDARYLMAQPAGADLDGDGLPDTVIVEPSIHPFKTKSKQHPNGVDEGVTLDKPHVRVGLRHSTIK